MRVSDSQRSWQSLNRPLIGQKVGQKVKIGILSDLKARTKVCPLRCDCVDPEVEVSRGPSRVLAVRVAGLAGESVQDDAKARWMQGAVVILDSRGGGDRIR